MKSKVKMDLAWVKKEVHRLDKSLDEFDESFLIAVVLISSAIVGANIKRLATFTHYSRDFISDIGKHLRKNGVWKNGQVDNYEWFDKNSGGVAFWINVAVGQGYIKRVKN